MRHELPPLPFPENALIPHISEETMTYHYDKHHRSYVDKLNQLIVGTEFEDMILEEIVLNSRGSLFNNAAQAWNHGFYWKCLTPRSQKPSGALFVAIEHGFGSYERFQESFNQAALGLFGSGWAWLVKNNAGGLSIQTSSNAENPLRSGYQPVLVCDVWEHAYYIDYRNERSKYLKAIWNILNWEFAENCFSSGSSRLAA